MNKGVNSNFGLKLKSASKILASFLIAFHLFSDFTFGGDSSDKTPRIIRSITISRENVFTEEDNPLGFAYPVLNKFHIVTRKQIIRQELLFEIGDEVDSDLFSETERNLRKLNYIANVEIETESNPDGGVDVTVHTRDLWTTIFGIEFLRENDENVYGLLLQEQSLFGYGSPLSIGWRRKEDGNAYRMNNLLNRINGSRWELASALRSGPAEEYRYAFTLDRPIYSLDSRWGFRTQLVRSNLPVNKNAKNEFNEKISSHRLSITRTFGSRFFKPISSFSLLFEDSETDSSDQNLNEIAGFLGFRSFRFARTTKLDKMMRTEDLEFGTSLGIGIAKSGSFIGATRDFWRLSAEQSLAFPSGSKTWIFQRYNITKTFENEEEKNRIWNFEIKTYSQLIPGQTLAFRFLTGSRTNLEERLENFKLNDEFGLRGFTTEDEIEGEKILLMNIEDRIFSNIEFLTLSFGAAVFIDAGNAWEDTESFKFSEMNYNAGIGIRWELTKSATARVTRFDFAVPLRDGGISFNNLIISFASGQFFTIR